MKELLDKEKLRELAVDVLDSEGSTDEESFQRVVAFVKSSISESVKAALESVRLEKKPSKVISDCCGAKVKYTTLVSKHPPGYWHDGYACTRCKQECSRESSDNGYNQAKADLDEKINIWLNG